MVARLGDTSESSATAQPHSRAAGFTLLEVLLVLALMVAMLAIALPTFRGSFQEQRLKKSAEVIRAEWTDARNRAMKTGRVHVFQHAIYGRYFSTTASYSAELDTQLDGTMAPAGMDSMSAEAWNELPKDVMFLGADVVVDDRSAFEVSSLQELPNMSDLAVRFQDDAREVQNLTWGAPIFFFPDGSSSSAQLVLVNEAQRTISVTLRGLTGMTRIGNVQSLDQLGMAGGMQP
mgnify:CR=1 FL=1